MKSGRGKRGESSYTRKALGELRGYGVDVLGVWETVT